MQPLNQTNNPFNQNNRDQRDYRVPYAGSSERPTGVTVIAILKFIAAALSIFLIWSGQQQISHYQSQISSKPAVTQSDELISGIQSLTDDIYTSSIRSIRFSQALNLIDVIGGVVLGWGLLKMRIWAKNWTIGLTGISVALGVASFCVNVRFGTIPISLVFNAIVIWYLLRKDVRDAFDYAN